MLLNKASGRITIYNMLHGKLKTDTQNEIKNMENKILYTLRTHA